MMDALESCKQLNYDLITLMIDDFFNEDLWDLRVEKHDGFDRAYFNLPNDKFHLFPSAKDFRLNLTENYSGANATTIYTILEHYSVYKKLKVVKKPLNFCNVCQKPGEKNCTNCKSVYYCSVAHKKRDRQTHKCSKAHDQTEQEESKDTEHETPKLKDSPELVELQP